MILKRFTVLFVLFASLILSSCNEYQKVLKSTDLEYKLEKAVDLYERGKYAKAFPIFDELMTLYRGTAKAEDVYYYYTMTEYQMGNHEYAAQHFKTFYQTFPNNAYADEAAFMVGFAYSEESPVYSLDQTNTYRAINELQLYINTHPHSSHIEECNMIIDELRAKLERKAFEIAKQYWHTQHYKAAVEAFNRSLNDFPDTPYREESMYLKLESSYELAINSIVSLQAQRLKETSTAYFELVDRFPNSKFKEDADQVFEKVQEQKKVLEEQQKTNNS